MSLGPLTVFAPRDMASLKDASTSDVETCSMRPDEVTSSPLGALSQTGGLAGGVTDANVPKSASIFHPKTVFSAEEPRDGLAVISVIARIVDIVFSVIVGGQGQLLASTPGYSI